MNSVEIMSILSAFQYEKIQFDSEEKCLYSDQLPLTLYLGRYKSSCFETKLLIPQNGLHYLFCSSDELKLRELLRNCHISSLLNGKTVPILFVGEKDVDGIYDYSSFPIHAGDDEYELINDVDVIYDMCLKNATRSESEKQLLIVFVVGLSKIKLFSDVLLFGKNIYRPVFRNSSNNPFDVIDSDTPDSFGEASTVETLQRIVENFNVTIPVENEIIDMLNNSSKYGITFIFGELSTTNTSILKQLPIKIFDLDEVVTTDIITGKGIVDGIIPWKSCPADEVLAFLCKEIPQYHSQWSYTHVGL